jgi:hypothetical protein
MAHIPWYGTDNIENDTSCCMYIRCRGNVFTEPLRSNAMGIRMQTHRLMRGIYEVRRWDGLRCHDIHTRFHKYWFRHSKGNNEGFADTQTAWRSHNPTLGKQANVRKVICCTLSSWTFRFYEYRYLLINAINENIAINIWARMPAMSFITPVKRTS